MTKRFVDVEFTYDAKEVSKATNAKIYRGAIILTPGKYADSATRDYVYYSPEVLRKYATNWSTNYLNIDHSTSVIHRIGYVRNPRFEDNAVKADLYIFPYTSVARDTIALIDNGLVNSLSCEIITTDHYDYLQKCIVVDDIEFFGCAVVTNPACKEARIK